MGRKTFAIEEPCILPFARLGELATALLTIPNSYAAPERTFSTVKKIFTEQRSQLGNSTLSALLKCKLNDDTICSLPVSAHCGWRVSRARHPTCALARHSHRSECEFYLEHFIVQLYLYVVCILLYSCIYMLFVFCGYFLLISFAHSMQFLHLHLSTSVRIVYSFVYFWHGIFILFISIALFNSIIV